MSSTPGNPLKPSNKEIQHLVIENTTDMIMKIKNLSFVVLNPKDEKSIDVISAIALPINNSANSP